MDELAHDSEIQGVLEGIDRVLDGAYQRMGVQAATHNGRPVVAMVHEALPAKDDEELIIWMEAWRAMLSVVFAEGPHPAKALKRLYSFVWCVQREDLANMSLTELALMFGETRAAVSHRVNLVYSDYLKRRGFRGTRVPGQKSEGSRQVFARKAAGNQSRASGRKLGDEEKPKIKQARKPRS